MKISEKDWKNYIKLLSAVNKKAADFMKSYIEKNGLDSLGDIEDYALAIVQKYSEASGALSAEMYDIIAEIQGASVPPAEIAPVPTKNEVAKTIRGVTKRSVNADMVANSIGRLVKRTGADTTLKNAIRDHAEFAWVPSGDSCPFCITLASRGWQSASSASLKGVHAEHIHANCDCTYAVRFDKSSYIEGYDPKTYEDMYYGADGNTSKERINSLRRAHYAQNKDKINAQKRAAYAERRSMQQEDAESPAFENKKILITNTRSNGIISEKSGSNAMLDLQFFAEKDLENQSSSSLERGIRKLNKEIEKHKGFINNPQEHVPDWDTKPIREKEGLKKHWNKEIANYRESIQNRIDELKKRGDYNE